MAKLSRMRYLTKREAVYDLTVRDNHNFMANNVLVHNCGK